VSKFAPQLDLLTGAWKRFYFEQQLAAAVSQSQRRRDPFSLIQLDVDDLHEHNDVHGKVSVDAALGWLASKLAELINGRGPIGRLEGGTFATFLPRLERQRAISLAEQMRTQISKAAHDSSEGRYSITVSVGVVAMRPGEPWGNLLEAADLACRKAKHGGKDAVVHR
jgi:diguanylate cyclase (GGDEF)-like protein